MKGKGKGVRKVIDQWIDPLANRTDYLATFVFAIGSEQSGTPAAERIGYFSERYAITM